MTRVESLYVNGRPAGASAATGTRTPAEDVDLLIGMSHRKQFPARTERKTSQKILSTMVFDGLMDEVLNQPGTRPQDNVELEPMTIVNMNGEIETWGWAASDPQHADGLCRLLKIR